MSVLFLVSSHVCDVRTALRLRCVNREAKRAVEQRCRLIDLSQLLTPTPKQELREEEEKKREEEEQKQQQRDGEENKQEEQKKERATQRQQRMLTAQHFARVMCSAARLLPAVDSFRIEGRVVPHSLLVQLPSLLVAARFDRSTPLQTFVSNWQNAPDNIVMADASAAVVAVRRVAFIECFFDIDNCLCCVSTWDKAARAQWLRNIGFAQEVTLDLSGSKMLDSKQLLDGLIFYANDKVNLVARGCVLPHGSEEKLREKFRTVLL